MLMVLGASHHDLELTELERLSAGSEVLDSELLALRAGRPIPKMRANAQRVKRKPCRLPVASDQ